MGCIQKNCMKILVIHSSSDNWSQTNSGQGLKREVGLIFTEIILHFWESIALAGVSLFSIQFISCSLGFAFLQHYNCILSCASNFSVCVCVCGSGCLWQ